MARTTVELVAATLTPNDMDAVTDDLTPFMDAANILVTRLCAGAKKLDGTSYYADSDLEMIERWLSCHFYKIPNPSDLVEQVSKDAQRTIESKVDLGLNVTRYGQMAKILDSAGGLASADLRSRMRGWGAMWLGTRPEDTPRRRLRRVW